MTKPNRLILWGWFNSNLVLNRLIPDIEQNCIQDGIRYPIAYKIFQKNKLAPNQLYFHHSYAESNISMGQEYQYIALMENYKILSDSIQTCHSKIICFFTPYKSQPSEYTMHGHHETSLIQFKQGIPQMIYDELLEIRQLPFSPNHKQICLY